MTPAAWPLAIVAISLASPSGAFGQPAQPEGDSFRSEIFVGTQPENYLRYLQTSGLVRLYPWSSRPFSPRELDRLMPRDTTHPWRDRFQPSPRRFHGVHYDFVRPSMSFRYNTGFPFGTNDGPVWAGRGLTSALQLGIAARLGRLSVTLAPMAFRAENRYVFIKPTTFQGPASFSNALFGDVDYPQRFGDTPYSQLDPGQSTIRLDMPIISIGASTANMGWGPGTEYPLLIGNNAAGFPHVFLGSSAPIDIFVAKIHGKVMWARLAQSEFSPVTGPSEYTSPSEPGRKRFATGIVITGQPRGIPGLEIGAARFFHSIWPRSGLPRRYFTKALQAFLKEDLPFDPNLEGRGIADNQLVEVFARWVFPHSGLELAAEYGRDDHAELAYELLQEPDHSRSYNIGMRKVFSLSSTSMTAGRIEVINFQKPTLDRYRPQGAIYGHGLIRQGHTYRGQLLGADVGVGAAAGSIVAVDHYTPRGRWTLSWARDLKQENGTFQRDLKQENGIFQTFGDRKPMSMDVTHAFGFEMTRLMRGFDVTTGFTFVRNFNRLFIADAANISAAVGVRYNMR